MPRFIMKMVIKENDFGCIAIKIPEQDRCCFGESILNMNDAAYYKQTGEGLYNL